MGLPGLRPGLRGEGRAVVTEAMVTRHVGGALGGVLTTPSMILFMEETAQEVARPFLPPGADAPRRGDQGHGGADRGGWPEAAVRRRRVQRSREGRRGVAPAHDRPPRQPRRALLTAPAPPSLEPSSRHIRLASERAYRPTSPNARAGFRAPSWAARHNFLILWVDRRGTTPACSSGRGEMARA